jgi:hypothetical protein
MMHSTRALVLWFYGVNLGLLRRVRAVLGRFQDGQILEHWLIERRG